MSDPKQRPTSSTVRVLSAEESERMSKSAPQSMPNTGYVTTRPAPARGTTESSPAEPGSRRLPHDGADANEGVSESEAVGSREGLRVQRSKVAEAGPTVIGEWHLPGQNWTVLTNGWQSWSEADLSPIAGRQRRPELAPLVAQGHDLVFPPTGRPGRWRSHHLVALVGEGSSWVGSAATARTSATVWEVALRKDGVSVRAIADGTPEQVAFREVSDPVVAVDAVSSRSAALMNARVGDPLRVWCSWYAYFRNVTSNDVVANAQLAREHELDFDVFQLDDGFQADIGDWTVSNPRFGGHAKDLPPALSDLGFRSGLWLAPFVAGPRSDLYRLHPEWFVQSPEGNPVVAGENWGGPFFALDTGLPEVGRWLEQLAATCVSWGYSYLKLDFLYGAALSGRRASGMHRVEAYRAGLEALRRGAGPNTYLLGCGAPLAASVGLVDAMRIGPDTAPQWDDYTRRTFIDDTTGPAAVNALRTCLNRWYQHTWYRVDADIVFFRSRRNLLNDAERGALEALALSGAGLRATSDPLFILDDVELARLRGFLRADASGADRPLKLAVTGRDGAAVETTSWRFNLSDFDRDGVPAHGVVPRVP